MREEEDTRGWGPLGTRVARARRRTRDVPSPGEIPAFSGENPRHPIPFRPRAPCPRLPSPQCVLPSSPRSPHFRRRRELAVAAPPPILRRRWKQQMPVATRSGGRPWSFPMVAREAKNLLGRRSSLRPACLLPRPCSAFFHLVVHRVDGAGRDGRGGGPIAKTKASACLLLGICPRGNNKMVY